MFKIDSTNLIERIGKLSTGEIVNLINYKPEKIDEPERKLLLKFFSNLDRPVFYSHLQGILSGAIGSMHSRAPEDIRTMVANILKKNENLRNGFQELNIPDMVHSLGLDFFDRVFSEYGDDSIAQFAPLNVGFENVSLFQAMIIFKRRLLAGIEKSTRYKNYDKRDMDGNYQYYIDNLIVESGLEKEFREITDNLFNLYSDLMNTSEGPGKKLRNNLTAELSFVPFVQKVQEALYKRKLPSATAEELEAAYKKTIRAMHLDTIRHILPLSTKNMLAVQLNTQTLRDLLIEGSAIPTTESVAITELLRRELEPLVGPLIKDVNPCSPNDKNATRAKKAVAFRYQTELAGNSSTKPCSRDASSAYENPFKIMDNKLGLSVELSTKDTIEDLVEAILKERNPSKSLSESRDIVSKLTSSDKEELILNYAGILQGLRTDRRLKPGRAFERMGFDLSILAPVGEIRDLRRHRMMTYLDPLQFNPNLGFFIPDVLKNNGIKDQLIEGYAKAAGLWTLLSERINPYVATYALPMATLQHMHLYVNLRELHHICELRTQPGAHANYKRVSQMIYLGLKQVFPIAEKTMIFVDEGTEIDYGRAVQELRAFRKKQ